MWQAMEWVAAEVLSALPLESSPGDAVASAASEDVLALGRTRGGLRVHSVPRQTDDSGGSAEPGELVAELSQFLEGLEHADAFAVHYRLKAAIALEQRADAQIAPLLLRVFEGRLFRKLPDGSIYTRFEDYAADRLGWSARRARMVLRVARAARRCPALAAAWREGEISWMKVHDLLPVVTLGDGCDVHVWIEWARRVTVRRLRDDVARAVDLAMTDPAAWAATGGLPEALGAQGRGERQIGADPTVAERAPETTRFFFSAPIVVTRLFKAVVCRVRRRLERQLGHAVSEDDALRTMFDHFCTVWDPGRVPPRHAVFERDGWRCTVPGCSSYRNLHDHHIVYRSRGGSDDLSNRTTLCVWHHLRGEHGGRIRVSGAAPDGVRFELGLREGRPALVRYDACERRLAPRGS
jgi:hypothetical protein